MKASEVGNWLRQIAGKRDHRHIMPEDDYLIPSANSGGDCQGGEAGHAGLGARSSIQPVHHP